jgi:uncharacterized RDD family membrane protein YckC
VTGRAQPAGPDARDAARGDAALVRRFAAAAYEGLLLAAIVLFVGFLAAPLVSPGLGAARGLAIPSMPARVFSAALALAATGLYCCWSWTGGRRTLPMKTWRLTLERTDGRPIAGRTALVRFGAIWIGPLAAILGVAALGHTPAGTYAPWLAAINFLWAFVDRDRRFLHDRIAGTRVATESVAR